MLEGCLRHHLSVETKIWLCHLSCALLNLSRLIRFHTLRTTHTVQAHAQTNPPMRYVNSNLTQAITFFFFFFSIGRQTALYPQLTFSQQSENSPFLAPVHPLALISLHLHSLTCSRCTSFTCST